MYLVNFSSVLSNFTTVIVTKTTKRRDTECSTFCPINRTIADSPRYYRLIGLQLWLLTLHYFILHFILTCKNRPIERRINMAVADCKCLYLSALTFVNRRAKQRLAPLLSSVSNCMKNFILREKIYPGKWINTIIKKLFIIWLYTTMDLINNVKTQHGSNGKVYSGTHACSQMNCSRNRRAPCIYITGESPALSIRPRRQH